MNTVSNFFTKVKSDECWLWTGAKTRKGYGNFRINQKTFYSHRVIFEMIYGPIPPKMDICHTCDNPSCVNPNHLFVGTRKDNMQDCKSKGRIYIPPSKLICINGHQLTQENVKLNKKGARQCVTCKELGWKRRRQRINSDPILKEKHLQRRRELRAAKKLKHSSQSP